MTAAGALFPEPDGGLDPATASGHQLLGRRVRVEWANGSVEEGTIGKVVDERDRPRMLTVQTGDGPSGIGKTARLDHHDVALLPAESEIRADGGVE